MLLYEEYILEPFLQGWNNLQHNSANDNVFIYIQQIAGLMFVDKGVSHYEFFHNFIVVLEYFRNYEIGDMEVRSVLKRKKLVEEYVGICDFAKAAAMYRNKAKRGI